MVHDKDGCVVHAAQGQLIRKWRSRVSALKLDGKEAPDNDDKVLFVAITRPCGRLRLLCSRPHYRPLDAPLTPSFIHSFTHSLPPCS